MIRLQKAFKWVLVGGEEVSGGGGGQRREISIWKQLRRNSLDGGEVMRRRQLEVPKEHEIGQGNKEDEEEKIWKAMKEIGISGQQSDIIYIQELRNMEMRDKGEQERRETRSNRSN
ncbi:hypothetical protein VNO78_21663 [Psophocarpus tetragonolobus]|uniref:Uncharacterized protein n=1 Tax=Psophocarpus tetragonolobus TaxID=3891 RepID=A0AAN9SBH8_PSOTE